MNLKPLFGVLASIVPLITYIISTIIASVQFYKKFKPYPYDDGYKYKDELSLYFTSSYVTFILFIVFLAVMILAALNILKNCLRIIFLTFFDGAVMVTAGASLCMSQVIYQQKGVGVGMFIGAAVLLLVKIFPILPLTFELLTKGISVNTDFIHPNDLPFAIYGALIFGFIASLTYTGAALAVTIKCYAQTYDDRDEYYYCAPNQFLYSLPLFIFLQMMVAMVLFVQFKWKWGVRTFAVLSSLLLVILGYAQNMVALDLYDYTDAYYHDDFDKVLHVGNIIMTVTSGFMILITIFVNMAWPVLYNLRNPTGNGETNMAGPVPYNFRNPAGNEETKPLLN